MDEFRNAMRVKKKVFDLWINDVFELKLKPPEYSNNFGLIRKPNDFMEEEKYFLEDIKEIEEFYDVCDIEKEENYSKMHNKEIKMFIYYLYYIRSNYPKQNFGEAFFIKYINLMLEMFNADFYNVPKEYIDEMGRLIKNINVQADGKEDCCYQECLYLKSFKYYLKPKIEKYNIWNSDEWDLETKILVQDVIKKSGFKDLRKAIQKRIKEERKKEEKRKKEEEEGFDATQPQSQNLSQYATQTLSIQTKGTPDGTPQRTPTGLGSNPDLSAQNSAQNSTATSPARRGSVDSAQGVIELLSGAVNVLDAQKAADDAQKAAGVLNVRKKKQWPQNK